MDKLAALFIGLFIIQTLRLALYHHRKSNLLSLLDRRYKGLMGLKESPIASLEEREAAHYSALELSLIYEMMLDYGMVSAMIRSEYLDMLKEQNNETQI